MQVAGACWLRAPVARVPAPWARRLLYSGSDEAAGRLLRLRSISGREPDELSEFGTPGEMILLEAAADGRWLMMLQHLDGAPCVVAPGLHALAWISGWSPAGDAVFVARSRQLPLRLELVELSWGVRSGDLVIGPPPRPGQVRFVLRAGVFEPEHAYVCRNRPQLSRPILAQQARIGNHAPGHPCSPTGCRMKRDPAFAWELLALTWRQILSRTLPAEPRRRRGQVLDLTQPRRMLPGCWARGPYSWRDMHRSCAART